MPVWRLQCSIQADTAFPADQLVITPHFNDTGLGTDPQNLCNDLADRLGEYFGVSREIRVKAYDAQGTKPVYPAGEAVRFQGLLAALPSAREMALCLSFYADVNRPRQRGRLYIPAGLIGATPAQARPSSSNRQKVADLAPILAALGGVDVDWCVFSRRDNVARKVTNWWVDDAWDVQRSRGLRPTMRLAGTTSG